VQSTLILLAASVVMSGAEPPFVVGVCTHFQQGKGVLATNLNLMKQAGVQSIRDEASWGGVERTKGEFAMPAAWDQYVDRTVAAGIDPLIVLDYGNRFYDGGDKPLSPEAIEGFARYAEFVVGHFKGKVRRYEVWNEWDISIGRTKPGDAESYTRLLAAVYPRIKKVDPSITVMAGAMTSGGIRKGWLDRMLAAGALQSLDAVSIHTYNYGEKDRARTPEAWLAFVEGVAGAVRKASGGRDVPLYVTEMGWPTHTGPRGSSPELSAAYLARMLLLARTVPSLKGVWWYDFQDDGWKAEYNEDNFGTVRPDGTPKASYWALASLSKLVAGATEVQRVDAGDPDVWVLRFGDALAVWYAGEGEKRVVLEAPGGLTTVRVAEAGRAGVETPWALREWASGGRHAESREWFGLSVGGNPWIVSGVPAMVRVVR
jgi:hypothetical protein